MRHRRRIVALFQGLSAAATYVRKHDAGEMADDAMDTFRAYPVASLLVIGAAVVGGGILIASLLAQGDGEAKGGNAEPSGLFAAASNGLGPKASETVTRMRDAAFALALTASSSRSRRALISTMSFSTFVSTTKSGS